MSVPYVLDNSFGAVFIGVMVAATLQGVSIVQAWYYFTHQNDPWPIILLVAAVMTFDTVHQILITHTIYTYTITNWGNPAVLSVLVWSLLVEIIFNGLIAFLVQSFLALRVWRLSDCNVFLTGLIALLVLANFGAVTAYTALSIPMTTYAQLQTLQSLSMAVNVLTVIGDVLITVSLCTLLHRSRTGFHSSETMINKLILFSVNTGLITSFCAIASLISVHHLLFPRCLSLATSCADLIAIPQTLVAGKTFIYVTFFFCIGRLYTNSLLATLNARKGIRAAGSQSNSELSRDLSRDISFSLKQLPKNASVGGIQIDTTKEYTRDDKTETLGTSRKIVISNI